VDVPLWMSRDCIKVDCRDRFRLSILPFDCYIKYVHLSLRGLDIPETATVKKKWPWMIQHVQEKQTWDALK